MKCKNCGSEIPEDMLFCGVCGTKVSGEDNVEKVKAESADGAAPGRGGGPAAYKPVDATAYIIFSILATLFCFMPTGIPAIVYAAKIDSASLRCDYAAAEEAAEKCRMWCIVSAVVAAVAIVICVLIWVLMLVGVIGVAAAAGAGASMLG